MKDPTLNDIYLAIGELKGEVSGVKYELKRMNGTLRNHDDRINKNESAIDRQQGKATLCGAIVATVISAAGIAIAWFGLRK